MNYVLLPPDGVVKGSINNDSGTQAGLWLNLSLYKAAPAGALYSVIQTLDKQDQANKYSVSSNCPVQIKIRRTGRINSVKANFANTIIYNPNTKETIQNCHAYFTATQIQPGTWTGALKVVYPDGRILTVYGQFQGSVIVNRQVTGIRDKSCIAGGP